MPQIILASTSRYRRELLATARAAVRRPRRPTSPRSPSTARRPAAMAARLALAKARSIADRGAFVIGSDQVASLDGRLLRKPGTRRGRRRAAACMPRARPSCSTRPSRSSRPTPARRSSTSTARRCGSGASTTAALERYVRLESPLDCAGSFKAEGLGVALFEQISSEDPTALIGLPLIFVAQALRTLGADPLARRSWFRAPSARP